MKSLIANNFVSKIMNNNNVLIVDNNILMINNIINKRFIVILEIFYQKYQGASVT